MELGVFIVLYKDKPLEEALDIVVAKGIKTVEVGSGGLIGTNHCDPEALLKDSGKLTAFKREFASRDLTIGCLSCHGNMVHPQAEIAEQHHRDLMNTIDLAERLGVQTVVTFSGCPGDQEGAKYPNWPVSPWPNDFQELLKWQWEEKLIPYWSKVEQYASKRNIKIALEMHGGFSVHTPATVLKLRNATGDAIGANVDPSHLWWQGIDPVQAINVLGSAGAIHFFHAKDTAIDQINASTYGLTDMQPYTNQRDRSWQFRTVGYGHDLKEWANILSALRVNGYEGLVSIEHEDQLLSVDEGLTKAIVNLKQVMITEPASVPLMFAE